MMTLKEAKKIAKGLGLAINGTGRNDLPFVVFIPFQIEKGAFYAANLEDAVAYLKAAK